MDPNNNGFLPSATQKKLVLAAGLVTGSDFVDNIPKMVSTGPGEVITVGIYLKKINYEVANHETAGERIVNNFSKGLSKVIGVKPRDNEADFQFTLISLLNSVKNSLWAHSERYVYITPELKEILDKILESGTVFFSGLGHEHGCFWGNLNLSAQLSFHDEEILASDKLSNRAVPAGTEFLSAMLANPYWLPTVNNSAVPFAYILRGCKVGPIGESGKEGYLYIKYGYGNIEVGVDDGSKDFSPCLVVYPTWEQFHV